MVGIEQDVARHYTHGSLEPAITAGLSAVDTASDEALIAALAAVDEFHMGGRAATMAIADQLDVQPGMRVLDVGCGIGGAARSIASRFGCRVTGVDLTPEYVEVGNSLNRRIGLAETIDLRVGSALNLPLDDASVDRAMMLHVGMNIADKRRLCADIARVLKPGGLFAVFDVMRTGPAPLLYPVAWAQTEATSFVGTPDDYRQALQSAGLELLSERDRHQLALDFFREMKRRVAEAGAPPLGLHILMGADAPTKVANLIANLERGCIAPVQMIARRC